MASTGSKTAAACEAETPGFARRLAAGDRLVGAFLKTPSVAAIEILALAGMDFLVIDEEHSPFDRATIDTAIFACRAMGVAALVRVRNRAPETILSALDCGATGILAPHIDSARSAREVVAASRYTEARGYSGSVRSAGYGAGQMSQTLERSDREVVIIAQIEDAAALDHLDAIAAVEGVNGLFIGRGDLAVSLKASGSDSALVRKASEAIAASALRAKKPVAVFVGGLSEARWLAGLGATMFVYSSDQGLMRQAARQAVTDMAALVPETDPEPTA